MTARYARATLFATPRAREQAGQLVDALDRATADHQLVELADIELEDDLRTLLHRLLRIIGDGGTTTVGEMPEVITTTVAADLLGVSRTTLMKHVASGAVPSFRVGSHTKLHRDDVLAFRRQRRQEQRDALERLLADSDSRDD